MTPEKALSAVLSGAAGVAIGWAATSLTLTGRVDALEATQGRIEAKLDRIIEAKGIANAEATAFPR